jgi:hypothetical protein
MNFIITADDLCIGLTTHATSLKTVLEARVALKKL